MLIEVKVKTVRTSGEKPVKKTETYILDKEFFAQAEYAISTSLVEQGDVESFEVVSLRQSGIKEICDQYTGEHNYIATLKDLYHDDDGNEKVLRYKVLLWADDLTGATSNVRELQHEGYDMVVEGLKEVDYHYLSDVDQ